VARLGGDEFCVLLPRRPPASAAKSRRRSWGQDRQPRRHRAVCRPPQGRRGCDHARPLSAAAELPQIPGLTGEAGSYAERLFTFPVIAKLPCDDARAALVEPARQQKVEYAEAAVELALEWTEGYPSYIQQLGKHAWNLADSSPIGRDDIEAARPAAQTALDRSIYEVRVQRATEQERRYMRAMAELGNGPYRSGAVAGKLGKTTGAVSVIQRLLDKGLAYATEDYGYRLPTEADESASTRRSIQVAL
jgi:hypothetical protein